MAKKRVVAGVHGFFYYSEECRKDRESRGWMPTMRVQLADGSVAEFTHYTKRYRCGTIFSPDEKYLGEGVTVS